MFKRMNVTVLGSVGIGVLPDADGYGEKLDQPVGSFGKMAEISILGFASLSS